MFMILCVFIATIMFLCGYALYERYLRSKEVLTHCYTFTYDDVLIYVTSQTKLNDDEILYHKKEVANRMTGDAENHKIIGVTYLGTKGLLDSIVQ